MAADACLQKAHQTDELQAFQELARYVGSSVKACSLCRCDSIRGTLLGCRLKHRLTVLRQKRQMVVQTCEKEDGRTAQFKQVIKVYLQNESSASKLQQVHA